MAQRRPAIETKSITEVRSNLSAVTKEVYAGEARIAVKKSDIPLQGVVSIDDLGRLQRHREQMRELQEVRESMAHALRDVSEEELEHEIETALTADRQERRAAKSRAATAR